MAKTVFEDGNILTRVPGTRVLAEWLNKVFSHRHDGRDQDGSAPLDYAADTGAVNALVAAMPTPFDALIVGYPFGVRVAQTNTGAVTVNVDSLGAHPLHKLGGLDLDPGDIQATQIIRIAWDGAAFQLLSYNSPPVTDAATLGGHTAHTLMPPGGIIPFGMPSVPVGWLPCDGRAVLREQYADLFAAIGTTWGAGDNVSTFVLPEFRGEFLRGWDNDRGVDVAREFASFQAGMVGAHSHPAQYLVDGEGAAGAPEGGSGLSAGTWNTGLSTGTETRPRNISVMYCIKY